MFPHHKSSAAGRRAETLAQHHHNIQQQVEVHNFGKQGNCINNNNSSSSRKSSAGYSLAHHNGKNSTQYLESQFDSSHFLKSNTLTRNDDEDVKFYGRNFNLHFPELVTGCSPTSTPSHEMKSASSQPTRVNSERIELQQFDVSPQRLEGEAEVNSHHFDERKMSNFIQKRPGFPQVSC